MSFPPDYYMFKTEMEPSMAWALSDMIAHGNLLTRVDMQPDMVDEYEHYVKLACSKTLEPPSADPLLMACFRSAPALKISVFALNYKLINYHL